MREMTVAYVFTEAELCLLARIMGYKLPPELPVSACEAEGLSRACETLAASGLIIRDVDSLVVDVQAAWIMHTLCQRIWALSLDSMDGLFICLTGREACALAERISGGRWVITPAQTTDEALELLREALAEGQTEYTIRLSGEGNDVRTHATADALLAGLSRWREEETAKEKNHGDDHRRNNGAGLQRDI